MSLDSLYIGSRFQVPEIILKEISNYLVIQAKWLVFTAHFYLFFVSTNLFFNPPRHIFRRYILLFFLGWYEDCCSTDDMERMDMA